jgi:TonB family protein
MRNLRCSGHGYWLVATLVIVECLPVWCQAGLQDQLNSNYKDKTLLLRNFYAGNDLTYDRNGILQGPAREGPWSLAEVQIKLLHLTAQGLEISGSRLGALYTGERVSLVKTANVQIHVLDPNLGTGTKDSLDSILRKIFVDPAHEELAPLLPDIWKYYLAGTDLESRSNAWKLSHHKGPIVPLSARDWPKTLSPPRAMHAPDPKYTKEAKSQRIDGRSLLTTVVDASGSATQIAILVPLGMGLDEESVALLKQWRFQPAMLNGKPVSVEVNIEIQFKCCP